MRVLIAVAHADDETLGCFSVMESQPEEIWILHATDSAPLDVAYAQRAGFSSREDYARARHAEILEAMHHAGIPHSHYHSLQIPDQDVPRDWHRVRRYVESFGADRIYTHAYEGGHPDHDAMAYALAGLENVIEFPLYHSHGGDFVPHSFIDNDGDAETVILDELQRTRKADLLSCFRSQQRVITNFPVARELFRHARPYDFARPPHDGPLYYEIRKLGWTWPEWRLAVTASAG